ncbi:MAG: hypothetical protein MUF13_12640 [Akkermansiaceae bacterium]|nr:hypothetical protein [Akkermansiaceae bacterium]
MNTYLLGDHHTNYDQLLQALLRNGWRDARIIHVGDGEEGYPGKWDDETAQRLDKGFSALGIEYLSIRGNHSNPHVFDGSILLPNFKLLPDYSRLEINGESWLFVGGAVSINRIERELGKTWWVEEDMVLREDLAHPADVLVTHAGPSWLCPPTNLMVEAFIRSEEAIGCNSLRQELADEQVRHDRLFDLVKPRHWYFGHYHHRADHQHEGCTIKQLGLADVVMHVPDEIHRRAEG